MYYVYALRTIHLNLPTSAHNNGVQKATRMDSPRVWTTIEMARDAEQIMAATLSA